MPLRPAVWQVDWETRRPDGNFFKTDVDALSSIQCFDTVTSETQKGHLDHGNIFIPQNIWKNRGSLLTLVHPKLLLKWRRTTKHFVSCAFVPVVDWWMTFNLNSQSSKLGRFPRSLQSTVTQTKQQVQVKWHTLKQSQYNNNNKSMCTTPVKKFTLTASI